MGRTGRSSPVLGRLPLPDSPDDMTRTEGTELIPGWGPRGTSREPGWFRCGRTAPRRHDRREGPHAYLSCMPRDRRPPVNHDDMRAGARGRRAGGSHVRGATTTARWPRGWPASCSRPTARARAAARIRAGTGAGAWRHAGGARGLPARSGCPPSEPGGCAGRTGRRATWPASARRRASARVRSCADTAYRGTSARRPAGPRGAGASTSGTGCAPSIWAMPGRRDRQGLRPGAARRRTRAREVCSVKLF